MNSNARQENQDVSASLAMYRESMDVAQTAKDYAARILRSASGIGAGDRQWLHDVKRDRVNLRTTIRLFELASAADIADALYGPMAFRGVLVREIQPVVPIYEVATRDEEESNHFGNLAQFTFGERRSVSTAEELSGWMDIQALRSMQLADAARLAVARSIHVVSR